MQAIVQVLHPDALRGRRRHAVTPITLARTLLACHRPQDLASTPVRGTPASRPRWPDAQPPEELESQGPFQLPVWRVLAL